MLRMMIWGVLANHLEFINFSFFINLNLNANLWCKEVNFKFEWPELNWIIALCVCEEWPARKSQGGRGFSVSFYLFLFLFMAKPQMVKGHDESAACPLNGSVSGELASHRHWDGCVLSFRFDWIDTAMRLDINISALMRQFGTQEEIGIQKCILNEFEVILNSEWPS